MLKKLLVGGVSLAAFGAGVVGPAVAQDDEADDVIVVTGSLIRGTPEDAALPVEVYTSTELQEQGSPSALEFAKELTISGPTQGESNFFGGSAVGTATNFNLRGLGADKTLVLLNGRRVSENPTFMPAAAIGRIEILKDGAAVTYGADATGGVVNYITRNSFEGLEVAGRYKWIDGSEGDYSLSALGGFGSDVTNFMWSLEWDHRSELETEERDWASLPYTTNPAPWSALTNLGYYTPRGPIPGGVPGNTIDGEFGPSLLGVGEDPLNDTSAAACGAIGGQFRALSFIGLEDACYYSYASYYNLVEDSDAYRAFAQLNTEITPNMDFHSEVAYGQAKTSLQVSPSLPTFQGPARNTNSDQFFIPASNPFVAQFLTDQGYAPPGGFAGFSIGTPLSVFYRPLAHGGTSAFDDTSTVNDYDTQSWRVTGGINGTFAEDALLGGLLGGIGYDVALTYNQTISRLEDADVIGFRLQEALNGFGGPNCNAADQDPDRFGTQNPGAAGTGGCEWWNPFATSFTEQPELGLANPLSGSVRGLPVPAGASSWENSQELQRWLFDKRANENIDSRLTLDAVIDGQSPIELPGGTVGWAAGAQVQMIENRETSLSDIDAGLQPCAWPEQIPANPADPNYEGCTPDEPGPFIFRTPTSIEQQDQQLYSFFGELALPVLDNLDFQAAVRREEFSGGLGETVYKISGRWNVFEPLTLRGSYGTNFQAPPVGLTPGEVNVGVVNYGVAGNQWLPSITVTDNGVVPETATAWNVGAIWQSQGIMSSHDFRLIVDYFDIETENEFDLLATSNEIADFAYNAGTGLWDCSNPFVVNGRIQFLNTATSPGGVCTATSVGTDLASVTTVFGNGPGQLTSGVDFQVDYTLPLGPGEFSIGATGTKITELSTTAISLDGIVIDTGEDRLGFLNFSGAGNASPEWRVNSYANYRLNNHNVRVALGYVSAVEDERTGTQYGEEGEDWYGVDVHYTLDILDGTQITASVDNIEDRDPPAHQIELGYDARLGSPLGRTVQLGVRKTF